ncbi:MAG: group III truncated hemoglobin [Flavobacteriales bacterium]
MRGDIRTAEDIDALVRAFYERARPDPLIGRFFVGLVWDRHIPRITAFWRMVLLGDRGYQGDPMTAHVQLAQRMPVRPEHFKQWLMLWEAAVEELFDGPKADEAKQRARTIAAVMAHKVAAGKD